MRTYTREEIEIGFRNWNKSIAEGAEIDPYDANTSKSNKYNDTTF